ncbi:hypothetical protein ScPMuIL_017190 [Solemya velum]
MPWDQVKYFGNKEGHGKIFLFDFKHPDEGVRELSVEGDSGLRLFPHGISLWHNKDSGEIFLFVVNHSPSYDCVEKFLYLPKKRALKHIKTYRDPAFRLANDVLATGEDSFYFTNIGYFHSHLGNMLELLPLLPFGNVVYYDGNTYRQVVDNLLTPNGIAMSLDGKYVYLCTSLARDLMIFQREENGNLVLLEEVPLYTSLDNPTVEHATGNILIGTQHVNHKMIAHLENPLVPAASQVLLLKTHGSNVTAVSELYSDDGSSLWGSTVASLYNKSMLIGTVYHKLMYCKVNVL